MAIKDLTREQLESKLEITVTHLQILKGKVDEGVATDKVLDSKIASQILDIILKDLVP